MKRIFEAIHDSDLLLEGAGAMVAAVMVLSLVLFLPREEKRLARGPFLLVVGYLALIVVSAFVPREFAVQKFVQLTAEALLLLGLGRSAFLLLMNTVLIRRFSEPLPKIVRDVIQALIYVFMALLVLRAAGVEPGSLLTTSALLTAVIGLSLQDTLGNLFAGLAIQAQRPFAVGDWIQFDTDETHIGVIAEINWRATRIITLQQLEITVPNAAVAKAPIINYSRPNHVVRREVSVTAPYAASPELVHRLLLQSLRHVPDVLIEPAPFVVTGEFDERGVNYICRYFIDRFDRRERIQSDVRDRLWYSLRRGGFEIPVPGRRVEVIERGEATLVSSQRAVDRRARLLASLELFAGLAEAEIVKLAENCRLDEYAPEEFIVKQGESTTEMFVIERGEVRIEAEPRPGEVVVVSTLSRGDFFGEMSMLTGEARSANVIAVGETDVIVLDHDSFAPAIESNPELAERISHVLAERQRTLREVFGSAATDPAADKSRTEQELLERIKRFFSL